jgi:hypothetical protein
VIRHESVGPHRHSSVQAPLSVPRRRDRPSLSRLHERVHHRFCHDGVALHFHLAGLVHLLRDDLKSVDRVIMGTRRHEAVGREQASDQFGCRRFLSQKPRGNDADATTTTQAILFITPSYFFGGLTGSASAASEEAKPTSESAARAC